MPDMLRWKSAIERIQSVLDEHDDDAAEDFLDMLRAIQRRDPQVRNGAILAANAYEAEVSS